jgi:hypothetical protein
MGDIVLVKAVYKVADQDIDVMPNLAAIQSKNYGAIELPIAALDAELRKDDRIVTKADSDVLKQSLPSLTVHYRSQTGANHYVTKTIKETLKIGKRSAIGQFIQKPGDVLWSLALVAAKGQFVFVVVLGWALVVMWSFKQWQFIEKAFDVGGVAQGPPPYSTETYGIVGPWIMFLIYWLLQLFVYPSKILGAAFGGPEPPRGWILKILITVAAALAPVAGFFFQLVIWFTVVTSIPTVK